MRSCSFYNTQLGVFRSQHKEKWKEKKSWRGREKRKEEVSLQKKKKLLLTNSIPVEAEEDTTKCTFTRHILARIRVNKRACGEGEGLAKGVPFAMMVLALYRLWALMAG